MADRGQATEQPTARRLDKTRKEGRFPTSREMVAALQFLVFALLAGAGGAAWFQDFMRFFRGLLGYAAHAEVTPAELRRLAVSAITRGFGTLGAAGGLLVLVTAGAQLATTGFGVSAKSLTPQFGRLNPLRKARELVRQNLPLFLQAIVLIPVFAFAVYGLIRDNFDALTALPLTSVSAGAARVASLLNALVWKAAWLFLALGVFDLWRQRRRYTADLRMTKQEVRDEFKELEGNPQTKMRVRRIQRDLLRRRMMSQVPKATAVIVNPTHYAVAIRYLLDSMAAPLVIAKGKNYLALRIRKKAVESQVPVIENAPLAQALYQSAEVGQYIPAHLYRAVAEVLAYIYRLMGGRLPA